MKWRRAVLAIHLALLVLWAGGALSAEEMYIITTGNGSQIVVRDYHFTGDLVEYTTRDGARGSIDKKDFLIIANMIGVPPVREEEAESIEKQKKQEVVIWLGTAGLIVILYAGYLIYVSRNRKADKGEGVDIHYGRIDKDPTTQGHLAFTYRGLLRRRKDWVIDVRRAYEEDDILFIEGICITTGKRKIFRADRVAGLVTDRSTDHRAPMAHFFVDSQQARD